MDAEQLREMIHHLRIVGETQRVEVKSRVGKNVLETLSAFSNDDGGIVLVGLDEQNGYSPIEGFDSTQATDAIATRCEQLTPVVRPDVSTHVFEGSKLVVVEVEPLRRQDKPCYVSERGLYKGAYTRTGDGERLLKQYEIDRLLEEKQQPTWDYAPVEGAGPEDLDTELLESFLRRQKELRPKTFAQGNDVAQYRLGVLADDHPTFAALLTMGDYPQQFFPRLTVAFALIPGTEIGELADGVRFLDSATLPGTIPDMVEAGIAMVRKNMRTASKIGDVYRTDMPDYPLEAVREALVNALMHRDYSPEARGGQVQIMMYEDRLEITNPGGLYGGVTTGNLGEAGVTSSRNQRLSTFLEELRFDDGGPVAENRGSGIAVIEQALAKALMPPPKYKNSLTHFTITFYKRRVIQEERHGTATDQVKQLLGEKESWSTTELVNETQLSRTAVQKALNALVKTGYAERTEPQRSPKQRYRVVKNEGGKNESGDPDART